MSRRHKTLLVVAALGFLGLKATVFLRRAPLPLTPEEVARSRGELSPVAAIARSKPAATVPATITLPQGPKGKRVEKTDGDAELAMALRSVDRLRKIPGAAPLVDDIVTFLKDDDTGDASLDNVPTDENGLAELDEHTAEHLIKNPEIRAKWQRLMTLVAQHPDAL